MLSSALSDGGVKLRDTSSPQFAAMQWIRTPNNDGIFSERRFLQRYALATMYFSMNGDKWDKANLWLTNADECEWFSSSGSLACDSEGNIIDIDLSANNLSGEMPGDVEILSSSLGKAML